jgi:hypothetical protein
MESSLIRLVRRLFARAPQVYLATLKILQRGSPEKRLYISIISKGDVVIDAGANVGYFTMLFSDLVGPYGRVHAFEPVPATFSILSRNLQRFPYKIDLQKCHVEGAELLVLRGAESTLQRFRPKVFLEVDERWTSSHGWAPKDVIDFLRSVGYKHFYCNEPETESIEEERFSGSALLSTWEEVRGLA